MQVTPLFHRAALHVILAILSVALLLWQQQPHALFAKQGLLIFALAYMSFVDMRERRIPNKSVLFIVVVQLLFMILIGLTDTPETFFTLVSDALTGFIAICVPLIGVYFCAHFMRAATPMGGGDVKLLCALGFCLGWEQSLTATTFACLFFIVFCIARAFLRKTSIRMVLPFAPSLALGTAVTLVAKPDTALLCNTLLFFLGASAAILVITWLFRRLCR